MGKTPVLGIASACWVALALNGCASNNQGRASGQKFQPAPLVQRTPPGGSATNNNAATTGFSATPRSMTAAPAGASTTPGVSPTSSLDPSVSGSKAASAIQQTSGAGGTGDVTPATYNVPSGGSKSGTDSGVTTRKTPGNDFMTESGNKLDPPPTMSLPNAAGNSTPATPATTASRAPLPMSSDPTLEPPPPVRGKSLPPLPGGSALPPLPGNLPLPPAPPEPTSN